MKKDQPNYTRYELEKQKLIDKNLTYSEYQRAIQRIAKECGV